MANVAGVAGVEERVERLGGVPSVCFLTPTSLQPTCGVSDKDPLKRWLILLEKDDLSVKHDLGGWWYGGGGVGGGGGG